MTADFKFIDCPECGGEDKTGLTVPMVLQGDIPRWEHDPTALSKGWIAGRCGLCGLPTPPAPAVADLGPAVGGLEK
jgi:hypothetical protein